MKGHVMTWQHVALITVLLAGSVALVALDQATLAGGLATAVAGVAGMLLRSPLGSAADRAPQAKPAAPPPPPEEGPSAGDVN